MEKMTTVRFYVWSDLEVDLERKDGESDEEFIDRAKEKAMKEQPTVSWMFDESIIPEVKEE